MVIDKKSFSSNSPLGCSMAITFGILMIAYGVCFNVFPIINVLHRCLLERSFHAEVVKEKLHKIFSLMAQRARQGHYEHFSRI